MMTSGNLIAFLGVAILVTVAPGQDMALVLRNTLWGNRRAGIVTSFGVVSGLLTWAVVASAGLTAVLLSSKPLFAAVKFGGALYLGYLGYQSLRSAWHGRRTRSAQPGRANNEQPQAMHDRSAFRQGIFSNLGNPKVAIFYSSLLPQFVGDRAGFAALLSLGLIHCLIGLVWLVAYALVLDRAGEFMRRPNVRRIIESVTGVVFIGLALRLATERR